MDLDFPYVHPFQDVIRCSRYDITYPLPTVIMRNQIFFDWFEIKEFIVSRKHTVTFRTENFSMKKDIY